MKINLNSPISEIKPELLEIQELVLRGDFSHTDLANWFFDFCTRIECGTDETYESMRDKPIEESDDQPDEEPVEEQKPLTDELPEGYVVGYGPIKGNMCKICGRIFVEGEIYADKGADSLCQVHAYQKGIIKMNVWQYERIKKEYGL